MRGKELRQSPFPGAAESGAVGAQYAAARIDAAALTEALLALPSEDRALGRDAAWQADGTRRRGSVKANREPKEGDEMKIAKQRRPNDEQAENGMMHPIFRELAGEEA
jgi:hypothetical protein